MTNDLSTQVSLAAALRQVLNQVLRLLEEQDPDQLLQEGSPLKGALESWRKTVVTKTSGISTKRARELENAKLEMMAQVAQFREECDELRQRNKELRDQLVKLNKREAEHKQELLAAQFASKSHKTTAKRLDLEIRDLRRRVRELEGGPALSAAEAAPEALKEEPESTPPPPEPEKPSLAEAIAQHQQSRQRVDPSNARTSAEEAFKALFKEKPAAEEAPDKAAAEAAIAPEEKAAPVKAAKKKAAKKKAAKKKAAKKKVAKKATKKKATKKKATKKKATKKKATKKKVAPKKRVTKRAEKKGAPAKKRAVKKAAVKEVAEKKAAPAKKAAKKKAAKKKVAKKATKPGA